MLSLIIDTKLDYLSLKEYLTQEIYNQLFPDFWTPELNKLWFWLGDEDIHKEEINKANKNGIEINLIDELYQYLNQILDYCDDEGIGFMIREV